MKLILTHEVSNLGTPGDVVDVKGGYGRNFLMPRGYAIRWTRGAEKQIESIKKARSVREVRDVGHANEIRGQLQSATVEVPAHAGAGGRLFGAVTVSDIAAALKEATNIDVDKRRIQVATPIKSLGEHTVSVVLHPEVTATVTLEVAAV